MKGLNCYVAFFGDLGTKKLFTLTQVKDGFRVPYVTTCTASRPTTGIAVDGFRSKGLHLCGLLTPSTVVLFLAGMVRFGYARLKVAPGRVLLRANRFFRQCHFVTEYIMTITNHIRRIEDLANQVIEHADNREYEKAHCALDDIEAKCHAAHRHIDHLQEVTPRSLVPSGD